MNSQLYYIYTILYTMIVCFLREKEKKKKKDLSYMQYLFSDLLGLEAWKPRERLFQIKASDFNISDSVGINAGV